MSTYISASPTAKFTISEASSHMIQHGACEETGIIVWKYARKNNNV
jgi:predicted nuclease of predicted toxin-antitoxin system